MEILQFLAQNWDVVTLIFTNIVALFIKPPQGKIK